MRRRELFLVIVMVLVSAWVFYESAKFPMPQEYLRFGGGAAHYPRLVAICFVVLAIFLIRESMKLHKQEKKGAPESTSVRSTPASLVLIILLSLAYPFAIHYLGFRLGTFLFLVLGIMKLKGMRPSVLGTFVILAISVVATGVIYLLFYKIVRVPLPTGELFGG
jgi:hypothetical protein